MTAKDSNKSATPQKKLSVRSALGSALGVAVLGSSFFLTVGVNQSRAEIIQSATENIREGGIETSMAKGGAACNHMQNVTTFMGNNAYPVRAGRYAFQHLVDRCGERSELRMKTTEIGKTYWYGWSVFIPTDWSDKDPGFDILNQWATYPNANDFTKACGKVGSVLRGVGSMLAREGETVNFMFQHQGNSAAVVCDKYTLGKVSQLRGKWVDFVIQAKWTGNKDGLLKLWMKIGNDQYTQKLDYKGPSYWNNEGNGPNFKMGLYKGDPNFKGPAPRTVFTDEYRLGNDKSSFEEVSPH
jgi:hypothetical protein